MPTSSVIRTSGLAFWMFWMVCENCDTPSGMNSSPTISPPFSLTIIAHPFGRDLAEIVVGGDRVDLLAILLHHPGDERRELLLRHGAGDDHVGVADAAFILVVVEGKAVELVDDRPIGFARGAGEAGEHDVDLVALQDAPHEFLIAGVVGLGVVDHQLDRAAGDTAGRVDLVGGELDAMHLADGGEGKIARLVFQHADLDRIGGVGKAGRKQADPDEGSAVGAPHKTLSTCDLLC